MAEVYTSIGNVVEDGLVTIALTAIFAVLCLRGDITGQDFMTIFLIVVSFYFGTQTQKISDAVGKKEE